MVFPFLVGLYSLFSNKISKERQVLLLFLLLSPLPAALTRDPFSTYRSYPMVFPYAVIISLGVIKIVLFLRSQKFRIAAYSLVFVISMGSLYRSAFILFPKERFSSWSFGYSQIAWFLQANSYPKVLFNDGVGVSYIELLFFLKYPPSDFQKEQNKINLADYYMNKDWKGSISWGKYSVRPITWREDVYTSQLIIAKLIDLSGSQAKEHFLTKSFVIMGPDSKEVYIGYLTNPEIKLRDDERKLKLKKK